MSCETCGHDWHGLPCAHDEVVRLGWNLRRETCDCVTAWRDDDGISARGRVVGW